MGREAKHHLKDHEGQIDGNADDKRSPHARGTACRQVGVSMAVGVMPGVAMMMPRLAFVCVGVGRSSRHDPLSLLRSWPRRASQGAAARP